ncbi:MAG: KamA family radical SAM protein [Chitinispirillaceae bacterium]
MYDFKKFQVYTVRNFNQISQLQRLSSSDRHAIEVVGNVLPFKVNNYVIEELIDWNNIPEDPIYQLTFPQKDMLSPAHFREMERVLSQKQNSQQIASRANHIRFSLNPHPAGQTSNVPMLDGQRLAGMQHKYREIVLFFPSNSQTCHAYCTFCFRWPQFVGVDGLKFAMRESDLLARYVKKHTEVTDILFTGGDPMVMAAHTFEKYLQPFLTQKISNIQTIRIGSKSLAYWPYRYLSDTDSDDMLRLFEQIVQKGYHLAFMAHFNHPQELQTPAVRQAIRRIRNTGAQIRTQSPVMQNINDNSHDWREMWKEQVKLGCIPYYMFIARDTGAQEYFAVSLERAWDIYRKAYQRVSGIARTVRGPSMSAAPGKVQILGVSEVLNQKVFVLQFLQGRDPDWVGKPFFAKYDPEAIWFDKLKPAFADRFFFEEESMQFSDMGLKR